MLHKAKAWRLSAAVAMRQSSSDCRAGAVLTADSQLVTRFERGLSLPRAARDTTSSPVTTNGYVTIHYNIDLE